MIYPVPSANSRHRACIECLEYKKTHTLGSYGGGTEHEKTHIHKNKGDVNGDGNGDPDRH